jgi:hypothetical protein
VVAAAAILVLTAVVVVSATGVLALVVLDGSTARTATPGADVAAGTPAGPPAASDVQAARPPEQHADRAAAAAPAVAPPSVDAAGVLAAVDAAAAAARGSIAVVVVAADGTPLVSAPSAGDIVPAASLVKLLVVGRLLALESTGVVLTDRDRALMERAVVRSDDTAMSLLWDRWDGAALVGDTVAGAGLTGTALAGVPGQWGEATTTATDLATLLARRDAVLGSGPAATLLGWMRATSPTAADGFGQDFGLLAGGPTGTVAAKQGWMCCVAGTRQLHSAGVLPGGQVVVLLGDFPVATSWARARTALDAAAAAVLGAVG